MSDNNRLPLIDRWAKDEKPIKRGVQMNGITATEAAEKWGITPRQVQLLCSRGRIPGAVRFGHAWAIPADAQKPLDGRIKNTADTEERENNNG